MTARILLFGVAFVACALAVAPGVAIADEPSPTEICDGNAGDQLVIATATGEQLAADDERVELYSGTTVFVASCEGGEPQETGSWSFDEDGSEQFGTEETEHTVTDANSDYLYELVVGEVPETSDIRDVFANTQTAPELDVTDASDEELPAELLPGTEAAEQYQTLTNNWTDQRTVAENHVANVTAVATEILEEDDQPTAETLSEHNDVVHEMQQARERALANSTERQTLLYEQLLRPVHRTDGDTPFESIENEAVDLDENVTKATETYQEALDTAESDARSSILQTLGIGIGIGTLLGVPAGAVLPYRRGKERSDFYSVSSGTAYEANVWLLPALAGAVLFGIGVAVVVLSGALGVIV